MGSYLSHPVLSKSYTKGDDLECTSSPLSYACVDMQGWRKSMEDSHLISTRVPLQSTTTTKNNPASDQYAKVFGVFDGHGGPEVARFCQRHVIDVIVRQDKWARGDVAGALVEAFHALDRMIDDPERREELMTLRNGGEWDGTMAVMTTSSTMEAMMVQGGAEEQDCGEQEKEQEEEGVNDCDEVSSLDTESSCDGISDDSELEVEGEEEEEENELEEQQQQQGQEQEDTIGQQQEQQQENVHPPIQPEAATELATNERKLGMGEAIKLFHKLLAINNRLQVQQQQVLLQSNDCCNNSNVNTNDVAPSVVQYSMTVSSSTSTTVEVSMPNKKLVKLNATITDDTETGETVADTDTDSNFGSPSASDAFTSNDITPANDDDSAPFQASCIINGRQVCTLSRHPVQAGSTSIVAVLVGKTLTVANAGDSRAVLCRAHGVAYPLSFDHKPLHHKEMERITNAGGFVNRFGRVNGNLNLSRSIGDLKYKQTPGLLPSEQMITAEPDVVEVTLEDGDEFFIIGCDGIWDCLSNEEAVGFVRERLDRQTPLEIVSEMLDRIVSKDPGASMGVGGDNMTCMVIDLMPHSRSYRQGKSEE